MYAVYVQFNLAEHVQRMLNWHPTWTERQAYCCLYWQPRARQELRLAIHYFRAHSEHGMTVIQCPEACGVNVGATLRTMPDPVYLEWPPRNYVYLTMLAGMPARKAV